MSEKTQLDPSKPLGEPRKVAVAILGGTREEKEVLEIGEAIIKKTGEVAGLYLSLCLNIRKNHIAPVKVAELLKSLGFHRVRISEINKVSNAPDDVFTNYQARAIGFNKALEFARVENETIVETPAAKMLANATVSPMSKGEIGEAISEDDGKQGTETKKPSTAKRLDKLAAAFFKLCKASKKPVRTGVWKSGDGLKLVLSKDDMPSTSAKP